jgi:hypothetical protein
MARRPNYGYEKRQRELKKQKKKAEKAERKRLKKEAAEAGDEVEVTLDDEVEIASGEDDDNDDKPVWPGD